MISNILPVLAFAGSAYAAVTCPLAVEITNTVGHVADVTITNTGAEAVTVFKGNTVLSAHSTKDLLVSDADDNELEFQGTYVNYKSTGLSAESFQTLQPGEAVTTSVSAAKTYKLAGLSTAKVTAIQGFHYVTGTTAPSSLKETTLCDDVVSSSVAITPDQSSVVSELISKRDGLFSRSRIMKRTITYSSCSTSQKSTLTTAVADAISLATKAYTAAGTGADDFTTWFKSTSEESKVQSIYEDVKGVRTTAPTISCTDTYGDCSDGSALLYTVPSDNVIVPCPSNGFYDFPELATTCADDDYDKGGSILHEMTHLYGTDDYAYGSSAARALSASKAAANADTYEMYAGSVRLGGCTS